MNIIFIDVDGATRQVDGQQGVSLMQTARQNDVAGIIADCGGACACATCHVWVASDWADRVGSPDAVETDLLEMVENCTDRSRLSCQIILTPDLDGLTVTVPPM